MTSDIVGQLIIYVVVLMLAISAHEAAHAWMSYKFGDDTAYLLGRVTLNPLSHVDPIGTLLIPIFNFLWSASGIGIFLPLIGWGRPTPVNPLRWRNKDVANVMVSIAGILANITLAIIGFVVLKVLLVTGMFEEGARLGSVAEPVQLLLWRVITLNASLAIFNLLPIPPLDGSKVLYTLLGPGGEAALDTFERYSFLLIMAAVYFGVVSAIFTPIARVIIWLL